MTENLYLLAFTLKSFTFLYYVFLQQSQKKKQCVDNFSFFFYDCVISILFDFHSRQKQPIFIYLKTFLQYMGHLIIYGAFPIYVIVYFFFDLLRF